MFEPVHPGEILSEEFLKPMGVSVDELAHAIRVDAGVLTALVRGDGVITANLARLLGEYFGTSAEFWENLQSQYVNSRGGVI